MNALRIAPASLRYKAMIGVGGIGSGTVFALSSNETLGREESRGGHFLDRRDYCKLHIISHYVCTLLGPGFATIPLGKVGDDEVGRRLLAEMASAGLDLRYVEQCPGVPTLFSFCFVYPDGTGGNLTTENSACATVDGAFVARAKGEFSRFQGCGIALAAPEVPLEARAAVLRLGSAHRFFRVASFTSSEVPSVIESDLLREVDLLALNRDEAAVAGEMPRHAPASELVCRAIKRLAGVNAAMWLSVTAGREGSWSWDGQTLEQVPALEVPIASTAGAGDAHLSGVLAGLAAGLPLAEAQQLGTLVAAVSVTSPHTIHPTLSRVLLRRYACEHGANLSAGVLSLVED